MLFKNFKLFLVGIICFIGFVDGVNAVEFKVEDLLKLEKTGQCQLLPYDIYSCNLEIPNDVTYIEITHNGTLLQKYDNFYDMTINYSIDTSDHPIYFMSSQYGQELSIYSLAINIYREFKYPTIKVNGQQYYGDNDNLMCSYYDNYTGYKTRYCNLYLPSAVPYNTDKLNIEITSYDNRYIMTETKKTINYGNDIIFNFQHKTNPNIKGSYKWHVSKRPEVLLENLIVEGQKLNFNPSTREYNLTVDYNVKNININGSVNQTTSNGYYWPSTPNFNILGIGNHNLKIGNNTIDIIPTVNGKSEYGIGTIYTYWGVTKPIYIDFQDTSTYKLNITRQNNPLDKEVNDLLGNDYKVITKEIDGKEYMYITTPDKKEYKIELSNSLNDKNKIKEEFEKLKAVGKVEPPKPAIRPEQSGTLSKEDIDKIKNTEEKTEISGGEEVKWIVDGKNVTEDTDIKDINFTVKTDNEIDSKIKENILNLVKNKDKSMVLDFVYEGNLPKDTKVKVNVDKNKFKLNDILKLYYYDQKENKLTEIENSIKVMSENGTNYVLFGIEKGGYYLLSNSKNSFNIIYIIIVLSLIPIIGIIIFIIKKKKIIKIKLHKYKFYATMYLPKK